ncbi:MAG TPA: bifunctional D-glycero-beta-D-manno-heptose-7-phosphate kinase/D-glycero-beta-D-manno-heptose 1-phosphate adenylyltransferase HldE [Methylophilaceae bacterium]|nr:bifunctional D-glycero-beta-D-manno-heptose-7-phosphate kinase/D-glycero-beta-D-manno-heptose 1-phosphate adenylyltransferase HldE [Methylophilaceae bacterium]
MQHRLLETVRNSFGNEQSPPWALVIGDLMLDRYLMGEVERISPEAPVPVVLLKQQEERAGGAANVAANLAKLGIPTRLAGFIGDDADGQLLLNLVEGMGIATHTIVRSESHPTITKTRIIGGHQQMMRLDQENRADYSSGDRTAIQQLVHAELADKPAVIVISDYAKGTIERAFTSAIIDEAKTLGIPVLVDPKGLDYSKYRGATALTPNKRETADACAVSVHDNEALLSQAQELRASLRLDFLVVTRGEEGISLIEADQVTHIPATAKQVFDVSGAGDTVIATLAAGLIHGLAHDEALHLANIAAGVVVGKVGTVPITREDLLHALISEDAVTQADKVCDLQSLKIRVAQWKARGEKIVFTNGCFDLLHAGHVTYLEAARRAGDRLVLGLNTDRSVKALKGPTRPIIHEADRARVLAALEAVDAVILFDEDTPLELIKALRPNVIAKGSDYTEAQVVGAAEVKSWGGKVALIPIVPGRSTTGILEKLIS